MARYATKRSAVKTLPSPLPALEQALKATQTRPGDPQAWHALARRHLADGQLDLAEEALAACQRLDPDFAPAWLELGRLHHKRGNPQRAVQAFDHVLQRQPRNIEALHGLLELANGRSDYAQVLTLAERILAVAPDNTPALQRKCQALHRSHRFDEALQVARWLITHAPQGRALFYNDLGNIQRDLGELQAAARSYQRAAELTQVDPVPLSNQITLAHYLPESRPEDILRLCRAWGRQYAPRNATTRPAPADLSPGRVLRVGMISDGFRQHPVGAMITPALEHLAQYGLELYCYGSSGVIDPITLRIMALAKRWTPIASFSDAELAQRLRDDGIDILIDLSGFNAGTRMRVIAMEPAPLIVKWVGGLINTTGVESIDYLITDSIESPPGSDALYTEKLIRLPDDYICYLPPAQLPDCAPPPSASKGYITFGCFNNPTKINDVLLAEWARLLDALPDSRLFLKGAAFGAEHKRQRVLDALARHGIAAERIRMEGHSNHLDLLKAYHEVDIALDPWPYSGGLTTCEALLMGVPVVTLPGPTFAGRHSATHLANAGLPELVTDSWDSYRARCLELAGDAQALADIRQHLRRVLLESPVCDGPRFARHLADALRGIWQRYTEGRPRAALAFTAEGQLWFEDEDAPRAIVHPEAAAGQRGFNFSLAGKIHALDHGGLLASEPNFAGLARLKTLNTVVIDPATRLADSAALLAAQTIQSYHGHIALGDGLPATLHACLDPAFSGTLPPAPADELPPCWRPGAKVLAPLPIATVPLDEVQGLERVDWLVLALGHDNAAILRGARRTLQTALAVQVRVPFVASHAGQTSLDALRPLLKESGFQLLRLRNQHHHNYLPGDRDLFDPGQGSLLLYADAVYVPNRALNDAEKMRLAFIMHAAYGLHDYAYRLIEESNPQLAQAYLDDIVGDRTDATDARPAVPAAIVRPAAVRHSLPGRLVISLTSYQKRFAVLPKTLETLLRQSVQADRIILWIAETERNLLPPDVLALASQGIDIRYCEDLKSYKKIVPTLCEEPEAFIVTADDDICYPEHWLRDLCAAWSGPEVIVAWRAHKIALDKSKRPLPYANWEWEFSGSTSPSELLFPTTGAGVLYPPHAFHADIGKVELFTDLCPTADDVWLYWMIRLARRTVRVVGPRMALKTWTGSQDESLWHQNLLQHGNDAQITKMVARYGFPSGRLNAAQAQALTQNLPVAFQFRETTVRFALPDKDDHIQRFIRSSLSFYELQMLLDIAARVRPGTVILDIGANIGNHTVFFGLFCQAGLVMSFEPQPAVYQTLRRNVSLNALQDCVKTFPVGLGRQARRARLGQVDPNNIGMTKLDLAAEGDIEVRVLDELLHELENPPEVSVIKIDVEGMELDVLRGAGLLLKSQRPMIYAEAATEAELASLRNYLEPMGYRVLNRFNATATYLFACD
ncbi:FkbM family methyltransferase [Bordetella pseudohinzii]|uniref:protein O-GlcNAc transferase n=1 Tax=Bordetella pseudohinzii TaxID=1331258 RepID=A0A0M7CYB7_9BORD|nr:FkbM family methyltransferase [Bordetella pseudohinzii]ANY15961.1 hypothetical protein BBN53_08670 [Bordetella pseudohinzii]KXA75293.1 hypothetical protein AW877_20315 [Bordetella pseudohinzii]KXA78933.1 hypothetical protein AW878_11265 [Bordetella pseudohinzii]CUI45340.1 Predicted O-linked N-acetylglucosamine transferase%2C SPINDLY family [Bordetella pseudohinzii]